MAITSLELPAAARDNVRKIAELEQAFLRERTASERMSDAIAGFAGTLWFVFGHIVAFVAWALVNARLIPGLPAFDPYPFVFLTMIVSMEGVLLAAFVLIRQNRMSQRADERAHLDLQVGLLSEREISKALGVMIAMADRLDMSEAADAEARHMAQTTSVDRLASQIRRHVVDTPSAPATPTP